MDAIQRMFCPIKSEEIMPSTFSSLFLCVLKNKDSLMFTGQEVMNKAREREEPARKDFFSRRSTA